MALAWVREAPTTAEAVRRTFQLTEAVNATYARAVAAGREAEARAAAQLVSDAYLHVGGRVTGAIAEAIALAGEYWALKVAQASANTPVPPQVIVPATTPTSAPGSRSLTAHPPSYRTAIMPSGGQKAPDRSLQPGVRHVVPRGFRGIGIANADGNSPSVRAAALPGTAWAAASTPRAGSDNRKEGGQ